MIFLLYGLFHKFHANVAFPAIYAHLLPNRKYRKYRVIIVSKPKISCEPKKKISLRGVCDVVNHTMSVLMTTFQTAQTDFKSAALHFSANDDF